MKKYLFIPVILLITACSATTSKLGAIASEQPIKASISALKSEANKDADGKLYLEELHALNNSNVNSITLSDHAIVGKKSFRFEVNHGGCGFEDGWSDCEKQRERAELYYQWKNDETLETWKQEKWYRFYVFIPQDYNNLSPSKTSLIQWKGVNPSKNVLVMFQTKDRGLYFNMNGSAFNQERWYLIKSDKDMRGKWTEIVFNTNWHPSADKGYFKVWIDGQMQVDYKGIANTYNGKGFSLRYGIYSSHLDRYRSSTGNTTHPQRVVYFDGVRGDTSCKKVLENEVTCSNLLSQYLKDY